jgi:Protein of unknown function (DUF2934)
LRTIFLTAEKEKMSDREHRIRQRAYHFWEQEGCPDGRAHAHWMLAAEQVAIEDGQMHMSTAVAPAVIGSKRSRKTKPQNQRANVSARRLIRN